jgi:hypothetical protein
MTVLIYVDTGKQVGPIPTISRSSPTRTRRGPGSRKTTPKAWRSNMRFWNEPRAAGPELRTFGRLCACPIWLYPSFCYVRRLVGPL